MNALTTPTILVVEDNPEDAALLHLTLHEVAELNVHTISDCTAALSYLSGTEPYDHRDEFPFPSLVVLDMHLPGHSGPRILKWIRENNSVAPLLLVILTKSPLGRVPGKIVERQGAATITFAPFMKIDSNEMATMIMELYQRWANGGL
jgi:CheY-like chemotaxis protein